jgi:hypothetical protein
MEWFVVSMNVEPSLGHVWTPIENDVFRYQETIAPNTWVVEIENFQL